MPNTTRARANQLCVLSYARGYTQWVYKDMAVSVATMMAPGFFADIADMIEDRDMLTLVAEDTNKLVYANVTPGFVTLTSLI